MSEKKLYRSQENRVIGGVCGGLGEYFNIDPVLVRLIFVVLALNGLGILAYFVLWLLLPDESNKELAAEDLVRANLNDMGQQIRRLGDSFGSQRGSGTAIIGIVLVVLGGTFLLNRFVPGFNPVLIWPLVFIVIGLYLLITRR